MVTYGSTWKHSGHFLLQHLVTLFTAPHSKTYFMATTAAEMEEQEVEVEEAEQRMNSMILY